MEARVLIIEDDDAIVDAVSVYLRDMGLELARVADGQTGLEQAAKGGYSLLIVDVNLPGISGLELCRRLRSKRVYTPVLFLTSRTEEVDKRLGFDAGGDDYLTKPFSMMELVGRVQAILRRTCGEYARHGSQAPSQKICFGPFSVDIDARTVHRGTELVELTATEFDLLCCLAERRGKVVERTELLELVWGYSSSVYDSAVSTHMSRLRTKLEPDPDNPQYLKTVWGRGYKLAAGDGAES